MINASVWFVEIVADDQDGWPAISRHTPNGVQAA
jgi:hypothetical protein